MVLPDVNIVEAFPNAFLGVCLPAVTYARIPPLRRGRKFDWLYDEWCSDGLFGRLAETLGGVLPKTFDTMCQTTRDHEHRAALVCLATAACVAAGRYTAVGDKDGGCFFLPP
jgi:hypothetical protein